MSLEQRRHSDVVGASPVGAAPTTSSFLTPHLPSMVWAKSTARQDQNHLNFGIWCMLYQTFYGSNVLYKESSHNVFSSMTSSQDVSDPCWQLALKLHLKCSSSEHVFKFQIKVAVKDTTLHKHKSNCGQPVNTSPPGQNGCHFADDTFRCISENEKFYILTKISLKFVPNGSFYNKPALV